MKIKLKKDLSLYIPFEGGYLHLDPLAKTSDDTNWSITLKVRNAMCISGKSVAATGLEETFKPELIYALEAMKATLGKIQEEIKRGNLI